MVTLGSKKKSYLVSTVYSPIHAFSNIYTRLFMCAKCLSNSLSSSGISTRFTKSEIRVLNYCPYNYTVTPQSS